MVVSQNQIFKIQSSEHLLADLPQEKSLILIDLRVTYLMKILLDYRVIFLSTFVG